MFINSIDVFKKAKITLGTKKETWLERESSAKMLKVERQELSNEVKFRHIRVQVTLKNTAYFF